jgi:hypothetical protein
METVKNIVDLEKEVQRLSKLTHQLQYDTPRESKEFILILNEIKNCLDYLSVIYNS